MQVYVVTAGFNYEGTDCIALYDCKSAADACCQRLQEEYDWAEVNLQTVHQGALAAA